MNDELNRGSTGFRKGCLQGSKAYARLHVCVEATGLDLGCGSHGGLLVAVEAAA